MEPVTIGLVLAGLTAVVKAVQTVLIKRNVDVSDSYVTGWSSRVFALPVLVALIAYQGVPAIEPIFWPLIAAMGVFISAATVLSARGYEHSDMSKVTPIYAFTPALLLVTSPIMVDQVPGPVGVIGVLLIVVGTYFLEAGDGLLEPFRRLAEDRGVQLIVVVTVIYSITANIDKIGIDASSAIFWTMMVHLVVSVVLFPVMVRRSTDWREHLSRSRWWLTALGLSGGIAIAFQMTALEYILVPYVIAIKRFSIVLAVILGAVLFDEDIQGRLLGALLMVAGVILISVLG